MSDNACEDAEEYARLLVEKTKRRKVLREYFQKQHTDPFRHASGEGGTVFDPAIQRYQAMQTSQFEFFKPTFRNSFVGIFLLVLPMVGYGYVLHGLRSERECRLRCGEIAYENRTHKFI